MQIWDPAVKYKGSPLIADSDAYLTGYEKTFGAKPNYITAPGTAGALALQLAIEKVGSLDRVEGVELAKDIKLIVPETLPATAPAMALFEASRSWGGAASKDALPGLR